MAQVLTANNKIKKSVAYNLDLSQHLFCFSVDLKIHGIALKFYVKDESVIQQLYELYPIDWFKGSDEESIPIFWFNNREFGYSDEEWEDSVDYECIVEKKIDTVCAIQRDFLGVKRQDSVALVCSYHIGDGFYNFLRWLMPLYFIKNNKYLLHSSCVLDPLKRAYFCFGPSGAGKTTISSLAPRKQVLGDDMNVLKIKDGRCWAQAGALGQAIRNPKEYSEWYPVVGFYWLKKAKFLKIESLDRTDQILKLSSSVANVFWPNLAEQDIHKIMSDINCILDYVELKSLAFPKDQNIWNMIWDNLKIKNQGEANVL